LKVSANVKIASNVLKISGGCLKCPPWLRAWCELHFRIISSKPNFSDCKQQTFHGM